MLYRIPEVKEKGETWTEVGAKRVGGVYYYNTRGIEFHDVSRKGCVIDRKTLTTNEQSEILFFSSSFFFYLSHRTEERAFVSRNLSRRAERSEERSSLRNYLRSCEIRTLEFSARVSVSRLYAGTYLTTRREQRDCSSWAQQVGVPSVNIPSFRFVSFVCLSRDT